MKHKTRNGNALGVNGAEHMELIMDLINGGYDKKHKPYPDKQLNMSVNMFIDTIQGPVSRDSILIIF